MYENHCNSHISWAQSSQYVEMSYVKVGTDELTDARVPQSVLIWAVKKFRYFNSENVRIRTVDDRTVNNLHSSPFHLISYFISHLSVREVWRYTVRIYAII